MSECHTERVASISFPVLGLDVCDTRIGLAVCEHPASPPRPLFTYPRRTRAQDLGRCREWIERYGIGTVVIGLPLNMDGSSGKRAQWMQRFARELGDQIDIPVLLQDERLSTLEARDLLAAQGVAPEDAHDREDAVAAALIIQRFLTDHQAPLTP